MLDNAIVEIESELEVHSYEEFSILEVLASQNFVSNHGHEIATSVERLQEFRL
jgi:hypothetical protein